MDFIGTSFSDWPRKGAPHSQFPWQRYSDMKIKTLYTYFFGGEHEDSQNKHNAEADAKMHAKLYTELINRSAKG